MKDDKTIDVGASVIGRVTFFLDDVLLDTYSGWILSWWRGERAPQGVRGELTRRCRYAVFLVWYN